MKVALWLIQYGHNIIIDATPDGVVVGGLETKHPFYQYYDEEVEALPNSSRSCY